MSASRRSFLALPVILLAADAAAQSASWFPIEGADKSFFVEMPGAPVYKVLDTVSAGGTPFVSLSSRIAAISPACAGGVKTSRSIAFLRLVPA